MYDGAFYVPCVMIGLQFDFQPQSSHELLEFMSPVLWNRPISQQIS